ncbi:MAG: Aldehyde ferredoxin oxidoreductase, partial [Gammaproteobacteria bacterium]|nr:Aldehyde ferredoxin oxidoreductase [Gammaproteobacteria bacterium]
MHDVPQYPTQGKVLFVDLAARSTQSAYLDKSVFLHFLGGR